MFKVRFAKLLGDLRMERGRLLLLGVALMVSLLAVGAVLGTWGILKREVAKNYLGTRPAHATLEMVLDITPALVARVRGHASVLDAEARDVILARARVGDDFRPLLLFVVDDFSSLRLNTFRSESGAFPPPEGSILLERSALSMAGVGQGQSLVIKTPHGAATAVRVSGIVHDPGLAPAWQERSVYAYATRATAEALGETTGPRELRVAFREEPSRVVAAVSQAEQLAAWLTSEGHPVHELRVPPPGQHPHQLQMQTVLLLLMTFAALSLVLSSILTATILAAVLARQVREIGVMKTLGATSAQLAQLYAYLVILLGLGAVVVAVPLGRVGARLFAASVATLLNLELTDRAIPGWVFGVQVAAGVLVPLLVASVPILRAVRMPVRAALDLHGGGSPGWLQKLAWLPAAVREALRRPARFGLSVALLATGGALFMTALAVSASWEKNLDKIFLARHYDVEIRFQNPEGTELQRELEAVPGVMAAELWGYSPAAFARPDRVDVVRTYPDKGHGSLSALAPPPATELVTLPVLSGRWLSEADEHGVVLNHMAAAQSGGLRVGDEVLLSLDGHASAFDVVGIVEEVGSAAVAYLLPRVLGQMLGTGAKARVARIVTDAQTPGERALVIRRIEHELAARQVGVEVAIPFSELRTAVGDHVIILIRALLAMAASLATVGVLGLGSTLGVSVLERTRELGVRKALGATAARVRRLILGEAFVTAGVSFVLATLASLPLSWLVCSVIGKLGFLAPLPFAVAPLGIALWLGLSLVGALLATLGPARRAANMTVREALIQI